MGTEIMAYSEDQISLIKTTVAKGTTDNELKLFLYTAKRTGLDPLARQLHAIKRWNSKEGKEVMAIQTGIDGYRLIAERSGKYTGQVGPFWCGADGAWRDIWLEKGNPYAAKVGVLRSDFKEPLWGVARFDAYKQEGKSGLTPLWLKMADVMIAKCAEALALRKAFPQELSGIYTHEEMAQADSQEPPAQAVAPGKPLLSQGEKKAEPEKTTEPVKKTAEPESPAPAQGEIEQKFSKGFEKPLDLQMVDTFGDIEGYAESYLVKIGWIKSGQKITAITEDAKKRLLAKPKMFRDAVENYRKAQAKEGGK